MDLALFAYRLSFKHPIRDELLDFRFNRLMSLPGPIFDLLWNAKGSRA